jgi:hypothetical protein
MEQLNLNLFRLLKHHHGGSPQTSDRLRQTLLYLADGNWHTTLDIQSVTGSVAVSSDVGDLRKCGYNISCEYQGLTENKRKIYRYRWEAK